MQKLKPLRSYFRYWHERMVAENIHFTGLHGKARASVLWLEHVITPAVRFQTSSVPGPLPPGYVSFSNADIDSWLENAFTQKGGEHDTRYIIFASFICFCCFVWWYFVLCRPNCVCPSSYWYQNHPMMAPRYRDVDSCGVNNGMVWSSFRKRSGGSTVASVISGAWFFSFFPDRVYPPPPFLRGTAVPHIEVQNVWTVSSTAAVGGCQYFMLKQW
jgi:hypothetical protein